MKTSPGDRQGFTLIEVMIALVILFIVSSVLLTAMSRSLAVIRTARNLEVARSLILRVPLEHPIESVDMNEMSESGTFDDVDGYTWSREIQIVDPELRPGLFLVTVRVQWSERGRETYEETSEFRYAPDAEVVTSQL